MAEIPLPGYTQGQGCALIATFFALCFGIPSLLGQFLGDFFAGALGFVVAIVAVSLLAKRFLPEKIPSSDTGRMTYLAAKFRERAAQIEEALRWGKREVPEPSWQDRDLLKDVHEMVRSRGLPFLRGFDFVVPDERHAHIVASNAELRAALETRVYQLRSRAEQLDKLASEEKGSRPQ